MSTAEAQRIWRQRHGARLGVRGRRPDSPCGTLAAHKRHVRHGETPCELCRLAARSDRQFRRIKASWQSSDRFAWLLHRAVLDQLLASPEVVLAAAHARVIRQQARDASGSERELWSEWEILLGRPIEELAGALIGLDERAKQLRSTTPFVGVIDADRRLALLEASKAS
jgi:hypothetical protein